MELRWGAIAVWVLALAMSGPAAAEAPAVPEPELIQALAACDAQHEPDACYRAAIDRFQDRIPLEQMAAVIERARPTCHSEAHELGRLAYARLGGLDPATAACSRSCASGCFHGVVAAHFTDHLAGASPAALRREMVAICGRPEVLQLHRKGSCAHAMGHVGLIVGAGQLEPALDLCGGFNPGALRDYCARGVFMEHRGGHSGGHASEDDLHSPCARFPRHAEACYRYQIAYMATRLKLERGLAAVAPLAAECRRPATAGVRRGCFRGIGFYFWPLVVNQPQALPQVCAAGSRGERAACVAGAVEKLKDYDLERGRQACAGLTAAQRPGCVHALERGFYALSDDP